ncbi:hypothetical protein DUZ99_01910 [Xylanibacillus composti]|uniref:DUF4760 domain-containing protein n=1 Tax=Xylanibacillus composti TaxID=1572762 RepID=A0A8J4H4G1_9BACL|nr:hypothetical protein [Xylanibacillus composti]MDT9723749.1 hypothetical protein [Xylanibacillus composti]GIQ70783.1 hypothetical protein XYCOK13_36070 [Xylanibacillus composti]
MENSDYILIVNTIIMGLLTFFMWRATKINSDIVREMYNQRIEEKENQRIILVKEILRASHGNIAFLYNLSSSDKIDMESFKSYVTIDPPFSSEKLSSLFDNILLQSILAPWDSMRKYFEEFWMDSFGEITGTLNEGRGTYNSAEEASMIASKFIELSTMLEMKFKVKGPEPKKIERHIKHTPPT